MALSLGSPNLPGTPDYVRQTGRLLLALLLPYFALAIGALVRRRGEFHFRACAQHRRFSQRALAQRARHHRRARPVFTFAPQLRRRVVAQLRQERLQDSLAHHRPGARTAAAGR